MKRIIDGKRYDTETAELVAEWWNGYSPNDFKYCAEDLYRTKKGAFFIYGRGGAMSKYQVAVGNNGMGGSSEIIPMDEDEARHWLETHECTEELEKLFGNKIEDA
jgi:hypothetical protein